MTFNRSSPGSVSPPVAGPALAGELLNRARPHLRRHPGCLAAPPRDLA
ncbi:hypothetical protein [Streptomyces sp. KL116D]